MTGDSTRTVASFSFTYDGSRGEAQVWAGSGSLDALKGDGSNALKVIVSDAAGNQGTKSSRFVGSLISPTTASTATSRSARRPSPSTAPPSRRMAASSAASPTSPTRQPLQVPRRHRQLQPGPERLQRRPRPEHHQLHPPDLGLHRRRLQVGGRRRIGLILSATNADGPASQRGEFSLTGLNGLALTGKATPDRHRLDLGRSRTATASPSATRPPPAPAPSATPTAPPLAPSANSASASSTAATNR